jgi:hypothetical protein
MMVRIARDLFRFKKRCQLFVRSHDVAFAIVAVSINNKNVAPLVIDERDASPVLARLAQAINSASQS